MKIHSYLWYTILLNLRNNIRDKLVCKDFNNILSLANLNTYASLPLNETPSQIISKISAELETIDIEANLELKKEFFKQWRKVRFEDKNYTYAQTEYNIFNKNFKSYFIKELLINPTVNELFRFRKNIDTIDLREGLNNFFNQCKFNCFNNHTKDDYWDNIMKGDELNKLLELLELNILSDSDLKKWDKIGFLNNVKQARFDSIMKKEIEKNLIEVTSEHVHLITVDINGIILFKDNKKIGSKKITFITEHLKYLYKEGLGLESLDSFYSDINKLRLIAVNEIAFKEAMLKKEAITNWLDKNIDVLLNKVDESQKKKIIGSQIKDSMKEMAEKIIFQYTLSKDLEVKESKTKRMKL
jgi:hypothetical protein